MDLSQIDRSDSCYTTASSSPPATRTPEWPWASPAKRGVTSPQAKEYAMRALASDPRNPVALKNLGAILGKEGDSLRALYYLRQSYEIDSQDPQTVYGLAFAA